MAGPEFSLYARHLTEVVDPADGPGRAPDPVESQQPDWAGSPIRPTTAAVWDEAFYPLATGVWSRGDVVSGRAAVAIGSLTKVFACPGLRVGYVHADPAVIARLAGRQPRWALNGLAAALGPRTPRTADLSAWAAATARRRAALTAALPGWSRPTPTSPSYRVEEGAAAARARLAQQGVLVRDCTSFGLPDHVRVAVPDEAGLARLVAAWEMA